MAEGLLDPEELSYFRTARRRVQDTYGLGAAQNTFEKGRAGATFARNVGDLTKQFDAMRSKVPWSFAGRGLLNSGLHQKAVADFDVNRTSSFGNLRAQYDDQLGGLDLAAQQLAAVRAGALSDVDDQERSRVAAIAAMLRAAR